MDSNEKQILERMKSGDTGAFAELVNKFKDSAYALCIKIFKDGNEAEDILQEAFIKFYNALMNDKFEFKSKLSTYFYTVVYNTSVDFYRKRKAKPFNVYSIDVTESGFTEGDDLLRNYNQIEYEKQTSADSALGTESRVTEKEISEMVSKYLNSLPEQYSVILTLFYINELSHDEISKMLKLPLGTIKNRIFRAKEKLRDILINNFSKEEILQYI